MWMYVFAVFPFWAGTLEKTSIVWATQRQLHRTLVTNRDDSRRSVRVPHRFESLCTRHENDGALPIRVKLLFVSCQLLLPNAAYLESCVKQELEQVLSVDESVCRSFQETAQGLLGRQHGCHDASEYRCVRNLQLRVGSRATSVKSLV